MRELRYSVASSLDGFIAGPSGEYDWIVIDPEIDFAAMYEAYGGLVMGRKSYESPPPRHAGTGSAHLCVFTDAARGRTRWRDVLTRRRHARAHAQGDDGKPLWLWGGGELFGELARAGLVDGIEVAVIPVVLGAGIPLMNPNGPACPWSFAATGCTPRPGRCSRVRRPAHVSASRRPEP